MVRATRVLSWLRGLRRLARDERGNALILTGAAMIPLLAMVGSGIDVGRTYVAHSRLQQACDAASLAGRWAVTAGSDSTKVSAEAVKYFNFNFPQGSFSTAAFTPTVAITGSTTKTVTVAASTTIPMSVMKVFGYTTLPLSVNCAAQQDFVNTDIVLVLDTTGSMAAKATNGDTQTKIQALRSAVLALYDQLAPIQTQLSAAGMRLRYSIVPYSSTVNVGKLLYAADPTYIRNPSNYQEYSSYCTSYSNNGNCNNWDKNWHPVSETHSNIFYYNGSLNTTWAGCIEERKTNSSITASTTMIPADAWDLDLDTRPSNDDTRWPAYDPYWAQNPASGGSQHQVACPYGARRLTSWTRDDLNTYLNNLNPDGGTYHDIGMIWGGRMISSGGVFGDSPTTYNGMPVNKFVIFMTDGLLDTGADIYSAYGMERYDKRVTAGALSSQDARHQQRFNLMCSRVKNAGASIWVVAFASTLDTNLTNCATNPGQASTSDNSDDLIEKFTQIGKAIGALRLTQ